MTDEEYVLKFKNHVVDIFNKERGKDEAKRANLRDMKSTQIENSVIVQIPLLTDDEIQ